MFHLLPDTRGFKIFSGVPTRITLTQKVHECKTAITGEQESSGARRCSGFWSELADNCRICVGVVSRQYQGRNSIRFPSTDHPTC